MATEKATYFESIRPLEQAAGREPVTSANDDARLDIPLVAPSLDYSDSAVTQIRSRENRSSIASLFREKKSLFYYYKTYRVKEGVSVVDTANIEEVLSRIPFAPSEEDEPILWNECKSLWRVFAVLAEETVLHNCIQTLHGYPWNPSNEARRGIEDASRQPSFRDAYRQCRHSSTALGLTGGAIDDWDFTVSTIQIQPLIKFFKEELMILLDDAHLEMLGAVVPVVAGYIQDTGVAGLPLGDHRKIGISKAEIQAAAILDKIGTLDRDNVNGNINTHYHLYTSITTIQVTHTILHVLDHEIVGRALRKTYQHISELLPLPILAYGATLVDLHVQKVRNIRLHHGIDIRSSDLANRLSDTERAVLNIHGPCLRRLEREKLTSDKYQIIAPIVREIVQGLQVEKVLKHI